MIEAIITLLISLIIFAFGYGNLQGRVTANKEAAEERFKLMQKELDSLSESNSETHDAVNKILITLEGNSKDLQFIKEKLRGN